MKDSFGREITNIRISVTDRCNLKCFYCMPNGAGDFAPKPEVVSLEEMLRIARAAARIGIRNFRITGGEPLVRPGVVEFLADLRKAPGVQSLSMTTNALLLEDRVEALLEAGKPAEALAAFEASLTLYPARFNGLWGAARAAKRASRAPEARRYYRELVALAQDGDGGQEALVEAQAFLAEN